ncbi:MAG: tetratricopeptide repeat protein [Actinomycetota bacterium]
MLDVTDATFQTEVVERSAQVPVVIDLWAEWCGPCRTLGPILEKVIAATDGKVVGVKVDVDANPQISQAFQVQSIPAVYALVDGQPVDGFMGAQPEHLVEEFVQRLLPTEDDERLTALVEAGDEASLRAVLAEQADHEEAILALAALLVDDGRGDEALELLARIPESPQTRHLAARARSGGEVDDLDGKLADLIGRVKVDDEARQEFVDLLEVLGPDDPRTGEWRRRLTSALY